MMKRLEHALSACMKAPSKNDLQLVFDRVRSPSSRYKPISWPQDQISEVDVRDPWTLGDSCLFPPTQDIGEQGSSESRAAFVDRRCAHEVKQPGDGSCLFHALSFGMNQAVCSEPGDGTDARRLRYEISHYIYDNPNMEIAGMPLKDWVKLDSGRSIKGYATKMAGKRTFGGAIEMEVFSRLKGMNVHVYERCSGGYRRTCCFDDADPDAARGTVCILYRKRCHYDALVLAREVAKL